MLRNLLFSVCVLLACQQVYGIDITSVGVVGILPNPDPNHYRSGDVLRFRVVYPGRIQVTLPNEIKLPFA